MTAARSGRWALLAVLAGLAGAGCGGVNRRFVIESNVPNAQVYIDNRPVGAAPAHAQFEYYGYHNIELVHPDYQRETKRVHVAAPWYAYPPIDFFTDLLWPFRVEDVRRFYFELQPARRTDTGELIQKADDLRLQGWNLPIPAEPALPRSRDAIPPGPTPLPPPSPIPAQPPGPSPFIPSVTP